MADGSSQPLLDSRQSESTTLDIWHRTSAKIRAFQGSRFSLYFTLLLVGVDVFCIFSSIFLALYECDYGPNKKVRVASSVFGEISLAISCLFIVELILSIWAFGLRILDAVVIIASFVVDVALHGVAEEAASLVVILRLWRIFKVVEEISAGASLEMDGMSERIQDLEAENSHLKRELAHLRHP